MDTISYRVLAKMNLPNVQLITLAEFEDDKLLAVKKKRTVGEYCWTCTASLILYLLEKYPELEEIAYLDSDLFFYFSPQAVYEEFGKSSAMIIPHRFPKNLKLLEKKVGSYNVGMLIFRNDKEAKKCLSEWKKKCLQWCFNRFEKGRYGDQAYLDFWPNKYKKVCVLKNRGAGLGPWNASGFSLTRSGEDFYVDGQPLIFYHFSGFKYYRYLSSYQLSQIHKLLFKQYLKALNEAVCCLEKFGMIIYHDLSFSQEAGLILKNYLKQFFLTMKLTIKHSPVAYFIFGWMKRHWLLIHQNQEIIVRNSGRVNLDTPATDYRRNIIVGSAKQEIPFEVKRFYWSNPAVPPYFTRGDHAHRTTQQIIFCPKGSFVLTLDDGVKHQKIVMNDPSVGIKLGKLLWHSASNFSHDCLILVLADSYYKEDDYIRNYLDFLLLTNYQKNLEIYQGEKCY